MRNPPSILTRAAITACALLWTFMSVTSVTSVTAFAQDAPAADIPHGTLQQIKVPGPSLAGNLEGDPTDRDVFVYLPPSYASSPNKRYPVLYYLHGYGVGASNMDLDAALTRLGVLHDWEVYDGDHGNRIGARFIEKVLPFFTEQLVSE